MPRIGNKLNIYSRYIHSHKTRFSVVDGKLYHKTTNDISTTDEYGAVTLVTTNAEYIKANAVYWCIFSRAIFYVNANVDRWIDIIAWTRTTCRYVCEFLKNQTIILQCEINEDSYWYVVFERNNLQYWVYDSHVDNPDILIVRKHVIVPGEWHNFCRGRPIEKYNLTNTTMKSYEKELLRGFSIGSNLRKDELAILLTPPTKIIKQAYIDICVICHFPVD